MDTIAVIVPAYNAEATLDRCLSSLLNQNRGGQLFEYQIIVIDDGSKDNTPRLLDEYAETNERLVVIHKENGGPAAARKLGIEKSKSDYLAFCDADDYVEPDWLQCMYTYLKKYDGDFSVTGLVFNDDEPVHRVEPYAVLLWDRDDAIEQFIDHRVLNGVMCICLYKRSLFEDLEWHFDMRIFEDAMLQWQILLKIKRVVKIQVSKYHYVTNQNSLCHVPFNSECHNSKMKLLNRVVDDCNVMPIHRDSVMRMRFLWIFNELWNIIASGIKPDDEGQMISDFRSDFPKYFNAIRGQKNKLFAFLVFINPYVAKIGYSLIKQ